MTDIEQKALALLNAVRDDRGYHPLLESFSRKSAETEALCRALEAHEADKSRHAAELREQAERFEAFRQEVSDAVEDYNTLWHKRTPGRSEFQQAFHRFILAPVDPLEESLADALCRDDCMVEPAERLRAALDARGWQVGPIVKKEVVNGWKP